MHTNFRVVYLFQLKIHDAHTFIDKSMNDDTQQSLDFNANLCEQLPMMLTWFSFYLCVFFFSFANRISLSRHFVCIFTCFMNQKKNLLDAITSICLQRFGHVRKRNTIFVVCFRLFYLECVLKFWLGTHLASFFPRSIRHQFHNTKTHIPDVTCQNGKNKTKPKRRKKFWCTQHLIFNIRKLIGNLGNVRSLRLKCLFSFFRLLI